MATTGFTKNAHRIDPYKTFKFIVLMDQKPVLGVSKVGALKRTTEPIKYRSGGDNSYEHITPGRTTYDAILMERGITHDTAFEDWANKVHSIDGDPAIDLVDYKKDLKLEMKNEKGHTVLSYTLRRCWVSEFTALPELDANANALAIESLTIQHEGWKRNDEPEPDESSAVPSS